jgi:hypothetical protein
VTVADNPAFFTSDNPVHIVPSSVQKGHIALADPRTVLHVPLSTRRFLTMSKYGEPFHRMDIARRVFCRHPFSHPYMEEVPASIEYVHGDAATIDSFNSITCRTALEWVCGSLKSDFVHGEMQKPISRLTWELKVTDTGMDVQQIMKTE